MWKWIAAAALVLWSTAAFSHEDRMLEIAPGGQVVGVPAPWGPVTVHVEYSASGTVKAVTVAGRRFRKRFAPCVLKQLTKVKRFQASGSWWHDRSSIPAYVSLIFVQSEPGLPANPGDSISVTVSLEDGSVLMGQKAYDPWWGPPQGRLLRNGRTCSAWESL